MGGFCSKRDTKFITPLASNKSSVQRMAKPLCHEHVGNSKFSGGMVLQGEYATEISRRKNRAEETGLARPSQNSPTSRMFIATNTEIINAADEGKKSLQSLVTQMHKEQRPLNGINVATILHRCALAPQIISPQVLIYLAECMREHEIGPQEVGNALYGMRGVGISPASKALIAVVAHKLNACSEEFNGQQIANALYGLQSQKDSDEVRELLQALEPKITGCAEPFCSQAIGNSLYGLHSLGESLEVKKVIGAIAEKLDQLREIEETKVAVAQLPFLTASKEKGSLHAALKSKIVQGHHKLDGQAIGNAVYGLQSIGDVPEVHHVLGALAFNLERVDNPPKAQEVANGLYGLRSQYRSSPEIEAYCAAMAKQIKRCQEAFTPQHIANALLGLRWLGHSPEVQGVLRELVAKVRSLDDSEEVRTALAALTSKVHERNDSSHSSSVDGILARLKTIQAAPEVDSLITALGSVSIDQAQHSK